MRHFIASVIVTFAALILSFLWAGWQGLVTCLLLALMEISFSFDNAVVNAIVLRGMDARWQRRFLTWGMPLTVAGMYCLFPILIVSVASGLGLLQVAQLALHAPDTYHHHLQASHTQIAAFGGMFLLMVFLSFMMDEGKPLHWLGWVERMLVRLGKLEAVEIAIALVLLLAIQSAMPEGERLCVLVAGLCGIVLYVVLHGLIALLSLAEMSSFSSGYSGVIGFVYLHLLDASFSLDAVVGAFAISSDIVVIVLGLAAGAMFVRAFTAHMVRKGTLDSYVYLEHGAHYAIGALAAIMLVSITTPVPEAVSGLAGVVFIGLALLSSVRRNRKKVSGA